MAIPPITKAANANASLLPGFPLLFMDGGVVFIVSDTIKSFQLLTPCGFLVRFRTKPFMTTRLISIFCVNKGNNLTLISLSSRVAKAALESLLHYPVTFGLLKCLAMGKLRALFACQCQIPASFVFNSGGNLRFKVIRINEKGKVKIAITIRNTIAAMVDSMILNGFLTMLSWF